MPAAVRVAPHRVGGVEHGHGIVEPLGRLGDVAVEGDGQLAQEMPGPVVVAAVGAPKVLPAPQAVVGLPAACAHHGHHGRPILGPQGRVGPRVGAGRHVQRRHGGLVVVAVVSRAVHVPRRHRHQQVARPARVFLIAAQAVDEAQSRGRVRHGNHSVPVAPPDLPPRRWRLGARDLFRILRRLRRVRRRGEKFVGTRDQLFPPRGQGALGEFLQPGHVLRPEEQPRVLVGHAPHQLLMLRQGERDRAPIHHKRPHTAPGCARSRVIGRRVPPVICPRVQRPRRTMCREPQPLTRVHHPLKVGVRRHLEDIARRPFHGTPRKPRRIHRHGRPFGPIAPLAGRGRRLIQLQAHGRQRQATEIQE